VESVSTGTVCRSLASMVQLSPGSDLAGTGSGIGRVCRLQHLGWFAYRVGDDRPHCLIFRDAPSVRSSSQLFGVHSVGPADGDEPDQREAIRPRVLDPSNPQRGGSI